MTDPNEERILKAVEDIANSTGRMESVTIITSRKMKERYEAMLLEQRRLKYRLESSTSLWEMYRIKRKMGVRRAQLLWPWLHWKVIQPIKWARINWKHRKDPEW